MFAKKKVMIKYILIEKCGKLPEKGCVHSDIIMLLNKKIWSDLLTCCVWFSVFVFFYIKSYSI